VSPLPPTGVDRARGGSLPALRPSGSARQYTDTVDEPSGSAVQAPRLRYFAGIDGLRAVAVMAVMAYHAGFTWIPGGFLGVEVFFAISGYLITALLLAEVRNNGRVALGRFWIRRARRLLPALVVMLAVVTAYVALFVPDELVDLRDDIGAALTYTTNWFLISGDVSYFEALGRPPVLQHLWSLAIEEQFYLLWPLVFGASAVALGRRSGRLAQLLLVGVAASMVWMIVLFSPDADPSRVYYGTDTRAAGLLVGAVAAVVWSPWRLRPTERSAGLVLDAMGVYAAIGLVGAFVSWDAFAPTVYRGGFVVVSLLTVVVIGVVVHPAARLVPAVLGARALVWIGVRSYGLYLWHWPIFMLTRPRLDVALTGNTLLTLRLGLTVAAAALSYRFVEVPVRNGALGRAWRSFQASRGEQRLRLVRLAGGTAMAVTVAFALLVGSLLRADGPGGNPLGLLSTGRAAAADTDDTAGDESGDETAAGADPANPGPPAQTAATGATATGQPGDAAETPDTSTEEAPAADGGSPTDPAFDEDADTATTVAAAPSADLPRSVTVVGDSTAMALALNFPAAMGQVLEVTDGSIEGCGIVDDGAMRSASHQRRSFSDCEGFEAEWRNTVAATEPDLALVVIGAWEVFDLDLGDGAVEFGSEEHEQFLRTNLRRGVDGLLQTGAQIALLEVPCYQPVDGGGLQALPERGDRTRTALLNRLFRELAAERSDRVFVVASPEAFCTDPDVGADLNLRWDGVHYGPLGGEYVWEAIAPALTAIPAVPRT